MAKYYPTEDTFLNASRGLIQGGSVRNILGKAFGTNSVVTGEDRVPWEAAAEYVFPTESLTMSAVSTSASDTSITVLIQGLNSNYEEISATVALNGTTPVSITSTQFFRINDAVVISGNAVGDISIYNN